MSIHFPIRRRQRGASIGSAVILALALATGVARAQSPIEVLGVAIEHDTLSRSRAVEARAAGLAQMILLHAGRHFLAREGLLATPAEIAEVVAYQARFDEHDRAQRAAKLVELDGRLAQMGANAIDRPRLEAFRATLLRLAAFEQDVDAGIAQRDLPAEATIVAWIERWKLDVALYARYGGVVGMAPHGPYAHEARARFIEEYERAGLVVIRDAELHDAMRRALAAPPAIVLSGVRPVDFTPFWRRPIPASYMPD